MKIQFRDTFTQQLPPDTESLNFRRQVNGAAYSFVSPCIPSAPTWIHASESTGQLLGFRMEDLYSDEMLKILSGATVHNSSQPYAMNYGGHQFGHWAGQLGDGRAINLGEICHSGNCHTLQLKGAGETPYSRRADGLAVLRSSIREHLCSEAMFHLGVPTTRSLSVIATGDEVLRDVMYDGHPAYEPGAVVCRVSPTFIRFGNFEIFAARGEIDILKQLADYTIDSFFKEVDSDGKHKYLDFLQIVVQRTLKMVIDWQRVGFVHGVMNTDNMSILGNTIDYGPFAFMDNYDRSWTPNTTDRTEKMYRFGNQPEIAFKNLYRLGNAIFPLIQDEVAIKEVLDSFAFHFRKDYYTMLKAKLGLESICADDVRLIQQLEDLMDSSNIDMTIFFRELANVRGDFSIEESIEAISGAWYEKSAVVLQEWHTWFKHYLERLNKEKHGDAYRKIQMDAVNPKYIIRNYMYQLAIDSSMKGDHSLVDELYKMSLRPYDDDPTYDQWYRKRPDWAKERVGCSMLSCSS